MNALVAAAAMTGEGRYREAAEEALGTVAALAVQAPRFTGWSLAAAEAMAAGPLEVAVVGPAGPARDELERVARRRSGRHRRGGRGGRTAASRCCTRAGRSAVTPRRTCVARWCASGR